MQKYQHFNYLLAISYSLVKLFLIFLLLLSMARGYLFFTFSADELYDSLDIFLAFFLGTRLDASILAYIFALPVITLFFVWILNLKFLQKSLYSLFRVYFIFFVTLIFIALFSDFIYFSFFGEHATLMIFGIFDDDTAALVQTALKNYNIALIVPLSITTLSLLYLLIYKVLQEKHHLNIKPNLLQQATFFILLIISVALLGRGSFTLFPLAYNTPDPTSKHFLNKISKNAIFSLFDAYNAYMKSKNGSYNLIKDVGYKGKIEEAFRVHTQKKHIDRQNYINNITYQTKKSKRLQKRAPNVVLIMVESFGMPLLEYHSDTFNIMGRLKEHFDADILFENFISSSNGTIVSLEPLLLNITARPESTSFAQSNYLNTSFIQASAKVYQDAGYETNFIYGGDLSWRNIGNFISKQGFSSVDVKKSIIKALSLDTQTTTHDWGVYDEYLYRYILQKLQNSKKPQFIFALTTNNHPPYSVPKNYQSNSLRISQKLKEHIRGDMDLAKRRFRDYAYALDMAGAFLDRLKKSPLADTTVVAITADNNTVEGIMKYDDYYTEAKKVPFYLYLPPYIKADKVFDRSLASSHKDIFPTLYNLTLSQSSYIAIGSDLLDKSLLHCGFNDAGVIMAQEGGFEYKKAITKEQMRCQEQYRASLAVTEYLIQSHKK